ncbi:hypothetical protein Ddye_025678 [Dipteronia dyeriana]|uniref:Uncharacterized protein n=1 Tax=Dipteronia dyeriana TaxID=168575 RepID=A0AAD9TLM6_9ROSI|nr:hypothetical protein Ddye_025678 [Dipteronia dyeriana]
MIVNKQLMFMFVKGNTHEHVNCLTLLPVQSEDSKGFATTLAYPLKHQLQNVKKGASSIAEFVLKVKTIGDSLKAAGQTISDNDLILSILHGVGRDYDSVVSVITSQRGNISLQETQYLLLNHEQRIADFDSTTQLDITTPSANFVIGNQGDRRNQKGGFNGSNNYNNGGRH